MTDVGVGVLSAVVASLSLLTLTVLTFLADSIGRWLGTKLPAVSFNTRGPVLASVTAALLAFREELLHLVRHGKRGAPDGSRTILHWPGRSAPNPPSNPELERLFKGMYVSTIAVTIAVAICTYWYYMDSFRDAYASLISVAFGTLSLPLPGPDALTGVASFAIQSFFYFFFFSIASVVRAIVCPARWRWSATRFDGMRTLGNILASSEATPREGADTLGRVARASIFARAHLLSMLTGAGSLFTFSPTLATSLAGRDNGGILGGFFIILCFTMAYGLVVNIHIWLITQRKQRREAVAIELARLMSLSKFDEHGSQRSAVTYALGVTDRYVYHLDSIEPLHPVATALLAAIRPLRAFARSPQCFGPIPSEAVGHLPRAIALLSRAPSHSLLTKIAQATGGFSHEGIPDQHLRHEPSFRISSVRRIGLSERVAVIVNVFQLSWFITVLSVFAILLATGKLDWNAIQNFRP